MRLSPVMLMTVSLLISGCIGTNETTEQDPAALPSGTTAADTADTTPGKTTVTRDPEAQPTASGSSAPVYPRGPGKIDDPGPGPFPIDIETGRYHLQADHFEIRYDDGRRTTYDPPTMKDGETRGDPGSDEYHSIEWTWDHDGVEMRLYMYLRSDGQQWWMFESRIYDGFPRGEWLLNTTAMMHTAMAQPFEADLFNITFPENIRPDEQTAPGGTVVFEGLRLRAFL